MLDKKQKRSFRPSCNALFIDFDFIDVGSFAARLSLSRRLVSKKLIFRLHH